MSIVTNYRPSSAARAAGKRPGTVMADADWQALQHGIAMAEDELVALRNDAQRLASSAHAVLVRLRGLE